MTKPFRKIFVKLIIISLLIKFGNPSFAQEFYQDKPNKLPQDNITEGMKRANRDIKKHFREASTDEKLIQQYMDTVFKDELTRKRECARLKAKINGKPRYSLDTAKQPLNEKISGDRKLTRRQSDAWEKYHELVLKLENNILMSIHIGSASRIGKDLINQAISKYDTKWVGMLRLLEGNSVVTVHSLKL